MRIAGLAPKDLQGANSTPENATVGSPVPAAETTAAPPILQSAVLQPALAALRDMPDIDLATVKTLSDALARGEVPFDAGRLAGLIERYHGKRE